MNIAIVLAVSEYQSTNRLPGCILDGQLVKSLLAILRTIFEAEAETRILPLYMTS